MYRSILSGGAIALLFAACGGADQQSDVVMEDTAPVGMETEAPMPMETETLTATARFIDDQGAEVGTATLTEQGSGVQIEVNLTGIEPGERGFHIHEVGSCDTPTFESAGSHYNPTDAAHGFDHADGPHAGDFRNLEIAEDGTVRATVTNDMVTLREGAPNSLFDADGSAFIVHAGADDYITQPTGDAGGRLACAVIEADA